MEIESVETETSQDKGVKTKTLGILKNEPILLLILLLLLLYHIDNDLIFETKAIFSKLRPRPWKLMVSNLTPVETRLTKGVKTKNKILATLWNSFKQHNYI